VYYDENEKKLLMSQRSLMLMSKLYGKRNDLIILATILIIVLINELMIILKIGKVKILKAM
jgi:hypothetical protein